jgi:hypothetical protein
MSTRPKRRETYSQHRLALELRYAVDVAKKYPTEPNVTSVRELIDAHPHGSRSRHVEHNLGQARLEWLYENGLLQLT